MMTSDLFPSRKQNISTKRPKWEVKGDFKRKAGVSAAACSLVAQESKQAVQFRYRLAAGCLDETQRLEGFLGILYEHLAGRAGLYAHNTDMMRQNVVEFPGDAYALIDHRAAGVLFAFSNKLFRAFPEL